MTHVTPLRGHARAMRVHGREVPTDAALVLAPDGHVHALVKVGWRRRPVRARDVDVTWLLDDGSEVDGMAVAFDTMRHADAIAATALRDVLGMHDGLVSCAADVRDVVALSDALADSRRRRSRECPLDLI